MKEDETVTLARKAMIGMSDADVRMCAGFPTFGIAVAENDKIWTYQRTYSRGSMTVGVSSLALGPVPGVTGATGTGADGFCNTQVRFGNDHVTEVEFAGDNNTTQKINGLCVSTIDACVVYAQKRHAAGRKPAGQPLPDLPTGSVPANGVKVTPAKQ